MPKGVYPRKIGKRVAIGNYRPKCTFPGCNNLAIKQHKRSYFQEYQPRYRNSKSIRTKDLEGYYCGKYCSYHHKQQYGMNTSNNSKTRLQKTLGNSPCQVCGWDKTSCDLHRIKPGKEGGTYKKNNIIVLCPNCHRLIHRGLIKI